MSCGSHWYRYLIVFKESRKSWILSAPQAYLLPCILKKTRKMKTHLQFYYKLSQASISPQWSTLESLESVPLPTQTRVHLKGEEERAGGPDGGVSSRTQARSLLTSCSRRKEMEVHVSVKLLPPPSAFSPLDFFPSSKHTSFFSLSEPCICSSWASPKVTFSWPSGHNSDVTSSESSSSAILVKASFLALSTYEPTSHSLQHLLTKHVCS